MGLERKRGYRVREAWISTAVGLTRVPPDGTLTRGILTAQVKTGSALVSLNVIILSRAEMGPGGSCYSGVRQRSQTVHSLELGRRLNRDRHSKGPPQNASTEALVDDALDRVQSSVSGKDHPGRDYDGPLGPALLGRPHCIPDLGSWPKADAALWELPVLLAALLPDMKTK